MTEAFLVTNGIRTGTQQIRQEIQIGPDGYEFMARVSSRVLSVDGNTLFVGCATSVGQRIVVAAGGADGGSRDVHDGHDTP